MEETPVKKSLLQELKPRTRREWIKFFANLLIVVFFIFVLWYASFAFREGYNVGMAACMGKNAVNWTNLTINVSQNLTVIFP
jgi:TRAP-type C4-dicarboxylate transport system permease small subunit